MARRELGTTLREVDGTRRTRKPFAGQKTNASALSRSGCTITRMSAARGETVQSNLVSRNGNPARVSRGGLRLPYQDGGALFIRAEGGRTVPKGL